MKMHPLMDNIKVRIPMSAISMLPAMVLETNCSSRLPSDIPTRS